MDFWSDYASTLRPLPSVPRGVTPGGVSWGGACTPPASLPNKILPKFTQLLPNFTQLLPNFYPTLPNFYPTLPNFYPTLPNFYPTLPNFYPTLPDFTYPKNFFRAFGAKTLPNSKIFTQLHPPWESELLRPCFHFHFHRWHQAIPWLLH